jgi:dienelactone hydrolase
VRVSHPDALGKAAANAFDLLVGGGSATTTSAPRPRSSTRDRSLVGWCLGGIMSLLAAAGDPEIPVGGVVTIARLPPRAADRPTPTG